MKAIQKRTILEFLTNKIKSGAYTVILSEVFFSIGIHSMQG